MEEATTLDERAFQVAKEDAMAAYAPRAAILGSGFLAGFVITWLPVLVYLVIFVWDALVGGSFPGENKLAAAFANLRDNVRGYASVAWLYAIAVGCLGILLAYLRALSCTLNWFLTFETTRGTIRLGIHHLLGLFGIPVLAGVATNLLVGDPMAFYILLIPILISGLVFNLAFGALQNAALRRMYRPDETELVVKALTVFIPRQLGANYARIHEIRLDRERRIAEVFGTFDGEATRKEVREIVAHFLRGYNPVHVRDAAATAAS